MEEDRSTMFNLTMTNTHLTEHLANLTTKLSTKDKEIKDLQCILDKLMATMRTFSMASMMQQPSMMSNMNMFIPNMQPSQ
eukprot:2929252-Ditylum_brightwellii.AAC.1